MRTLIFGRMVVYKKKKKKKKKKKINMDSNFWSNGRAQKKE